MKSAIIKFNPEDLRKLFGYPPVPEEKNYREKNEENDGAYAEDEAEPEKENKYDCNHRLSDGTSAMVDGFMFGRCVLCNYNDLGAG